jgi:hypothetical protein
MSSCQTQDVHPRAIREVYTRKDHLRRVWQLKQGQQLCAVPSPAGFSALTIERQLKLFERFAAVGYENCSKLFHV